MSGHPVLGTIMFLSAIEDLAPDQAISLSSSGVTQSWEPSCPCLPLRTWLQARRWVCPVLWPPSPGNHNVLVCCYGPGSGPGGESVLFNRHKDDHYSGQLPVPVYKLQHYYKMAAFLNNFDMTLGDGSLRLQLHSRPGPTGLVCEAVEGLLWHGRASKRKSLNGRACKRRAFNWRAQSRRALSGDPRPVTICDDAKIPST